MISLLRKTVCSRSCVLLNRFRFKSTAYVELSHKTYDMTIYDFKYVSDTHCNSSNVSNMQREMDQFMLVFPDIVKKLTEFEADKPVLKEVAEYLKKSLDYNIPRGKKIRSLISIMAYKELIGKDRLTSENSRQAHLLGWCIELIQGVFLVADDMIDDSEVRRDAPCWYRLKDVQMIAVNDVLMLENACYALLKHYFGHLPCYANLFELLHETVMVSTIGQSLDFRMTKADVSTYSMEKYLCIAYNKTAHFVAYAPIALPMILAGYGDSKLFSSIKGTCLEFDVFYQIQNDFLDCFGRVLKKPGTDIEDGKCTWLAGTAMEMGSDEQRGILRDFYGKNDPESISKVKQLYIDLGLPDVYSRYEENAYKNARRQIGQVADDKIQKVLTSFVNTIFGRT